MNNDYLPVANAFADWIHEQGHAALIEPTDIEGVHTVTFRTRGREYTLVAYEADALFSHLRCVFTLPDGARDELAALRTAADTQRALKVVKVSVSWDARTVMLEAEQFLTEPACPNGVLWRGVSAIDNAGRKFFEDLARTLPSPADAFIESIARELGISGDSR